MAHLTCLNWERKPSYWQKVREKSSYTGAQLLYVLKSFRSNRAPAVPYLITRVSCPTEDDCKKPRSMIEYLPQTWSMPLTLKADISMSPTWSLSDRRYIHNGKRFPVHWFMQAEDQLKEFYRGFTNICGWLWGASPENQTLF